MNNSNKIVLIPSFSPPSPLQFQKMSRAYRFLSITQCNQHFINLFVVSFRLDCMIQLHNNTGTTLQYNGEFKSGFQLPLVEAPTHTSLSNSKKAKAPEIKENNMSLFGGAFSYAADAKIKGDNSKVDSNIRQNTQVPVATIPLFGRTFIIDRDNPKQNDSAITPALYPMFSGSGLSSSSRSISQPFSGENGLLKGKPHDADLIPKDNTLDTTSKMNPPSLHPIAVHSASSISNKKSAASTLGKRSSTSTHSSGVYSSDYNGSEVRFTFNPEEFSGVSDCCRNAGLHPDGLNYLRVKCQNPSAFVSLSLICADRCLSSSLDLSSAKACTSSRVCRGCTWACDQSPRITMSHMRVLGVVLVFLDELDVAYFLPLSKCNNGIQK